MTPRDYKTCCAIPLLALALAGFACDHAKDPAHAQASPTVAQAAQADNAPLNLPPDNGPPPKFDGDRAMQYVKEIVKFGPRPLGSANHKKVEGDILSQLKGDDVENDIFTADTPVGKFPVHNIIAKFPS